MDADKSKINESDTVRRCTEEEHREAIKCMRQFFDNEKPKVGLFWYDPDCRSLYGVEKADADSLLDGSGTARHPGDFRDYWTEMHGRAVANGDTRSRFFDESSYGSLPKGRVAVESGRYRVYTDFLTENLREEDRERFLEEVEDEFNLPEGYEVIRTEDL